MKTLLVRTFLFIFLVYSHIVYSQDQEKLTYPLHVLIQDKGNYVPVLNQKKYMEGLDLKVLNSILSPKELWAIKNDAEKDKGAYEYFNFFYEEWYIKQLPIIVFEYKIMDMLDDITIKKIRKNKNSREYLSKYDEQLYHIMSNENILKPEELISFAQRYKYTPAEKLNLFLFLLHHSALDKNLLTVWNTWKIGDYPIVYVGDNKRYMEYILETTQSFYPGITREHLSDWLNEVDKAAVTSVLHEAVRHNRKPIFNEIIKSNSVDINSKDYLEQTALHIAADKKWDQAKDYINTLLKYPKIKINMQDFKRWTPFSYILSKSQNHLFPGVIDFLEKNKNLVELNFLDRDRRNLVLLAGELGLPNIADYLHKEMGVPWPEKVSLSNTYIDFDYSSIQFRYQTNLDISNLDIFFYDAENKLLQILQTDLNQKYVMFFNISKALLEEAEETRHSVIMSLLSNNIEEEWSEALQEANKIPFLGKVVKAIYKGDIKTLDYLLSSMNKKDINNFLYYQKFNLSDHKLKSILTELPFWNKKSFIQEESIETIYMEVDSYLSEAIRANQPEVVEFLLKKGANPIFPKKNSIIGNDIMTAILSVVFFFDNEKALADHKSIVKRLIEHPSVTKDFLNKEALPGLNYADFAAIRGHLPALKAMYKKGARVSNGSIWGGNMPIETAVMFSDFIKTAQFLLKHKMKEAKTKKDKEILEDSFNLCQKVFH